MQPMPGTPLGQLSWYARRPNTWGEFARRAVKKARGGEPDERGAASRRCDEIAHTRKEAFDLLGITEIDVTVLERYQRARRLLVDRGVGVAGAADTSVLYSVCLARAPESVLETGVAHGLSSLAVLLAMEENDRGSLVSIDMPYRGSTDDSYVGQAVPDELRHRWQLIRQPDRRGIPKAISTSGPFDVVHYDSDKTRSGRLFAYPLLWDATRAGGLFLSDDVNDDFVFLEFAEEVGVEPVVWKRPDGDSYAGALIRAGGTTPKPS